MSSIYTFDRSKLNFIKKWWLDLDKTSYLIIVSIMLFGLFMTTTASPYVAKRIGVDDFFFVKKQLIFTIIGFFVLTLVSFLNSDQIKALSIVALPALIFLLILVLLTGFEIKGSKRWINFIGLTLQPSEFAKVFFLIFNAFLLSKLHYMKWFIKYGISASVYLLIACLFISQPDFGMTLILTITWLTQLFVYGLSLIFIFVVLVMVFIAMIYAYKTLPHVAVRINDFLDTSFKDYQIERSLDSYVNGGFFGLGPGNGFIKRFIPDAHTDFIFAVISEEFGLIFSVAIIILFLTVITKVIKNISQEGNVFNYIALTGLISLFTLQFIVNVGVSLAILPTKGMTLPFISYGGSSMIAMSICFGVILSLTKKRYQTNKLKYFYQ